MIKAYRMTAVLLAGVGIALAGAMAQAQAPAAPAAGAGFPGAPGIPAGDYNVSIRSDADKALPNPYMRDETFFKIPKDQKLGGASGIAIDKDGKSIWIYQRCGGQDNCIATPTADPIWKFDEHGNMVKHFGAGMVVYPHGLSVDKDGNLWVTDLQSNVDRPPARPGQKGEEVPKDRKPNGAQVIKFSPDGKVLMRLGTPGVYGKDDSHFSQPSAVVTSPSGDIFVGDGHDSAPANNRIMKFDKTGKFIKSWPTCQPSDARQIDCSHALAMDSQGRLFVGNRGNNSVDIFDQEGKLLARWTQFGKPSGLYIDKSDVLYVGDSESGVGQKNGYIRGVHIGDAKTGVVKSFMPDPLGNPAPWQPLRGTTGQEGVAAINIDQVFISQVTPPGLAKYTPR